MNNIDKRALQLMEEEEPNCFSCKYYHDCCWHFKSTEEAAQMCVSDNYSHWTGNLDYFRSAVIYGGE